MSNTVGRAGAEHENQRSAEIRKTEELIPRTPLDARSYLMVTYRHRGYRITQSHNSSQRRWRARHEKGRLHLENVAGSVMSVENPSPETPATPPAQVAT